jgi:gamma-glutamyl-gamma-aminobutyrate hydrolase PuuD
LVAEAGGDPWALDASLQIGRPAQIDALARAFHDAGRHTKEASTSFDEALRRFKGAWNGERGVHPINDSAQVRRAARDLGHQCLKLTKIAAELEGVAAALAEAQRTSTALITALESHLLQLDDEISAILTREISESLSGADYSELDAIVSVLESDAIQWTSCTLRQLRAILSRYTECLNTSRTALGTDGYDPTEIRDTTPQSGSSQPVQVPPPTTAPEGVNRWWKSLSQEEKLCLLAEHPPELDDWQRIVERITDPAKTVTIGLVGKYVHLHDAYLSVVEALCHAGAANDSRVEVQWINSEDVESQGPEELLAHCDGILVPGGFGVRGTEGKIAAIHYARTQGVPFFGLCLGLQLAVVEFARNVCGLQGADSTEFEPDTAHPVIDLMPEQKDIHRLGGTMRLGAFPCRLEKGSRAARAYSTLEVSERHRHRLEVNGAYVDTLRAHGMLPSGVWLQGHLVEIVEIPAHPWFVATQFHPEFKSRPNRPHPLFVAFVAAALGHRARRASRRMA